MLCPSHSLSESMGSPGLEGGDPQGPLGLFKVACGRLRSQWPRDEDSDGAGRTRVGIKPRAPRPRRSTPRSWKGRSFIHSLAHSFIHSFILHTLIEHPVVPCRPCAQCWGHSSGRDPSLPSWRSHSNGGTQTKKIMRK